MFTIHQENLINNSFNKRGKSRVNNKGSNNGKNKRGGKPKRNLNPLNNKGEVSRCNLCWSRYHWVSNCPDTPSQFENYLWLYGHAFFEDSMESLASKTSNMALLDAVCTKTGCGEMWLQHYLQSLS